MAAKRTKKEVGIDRKIDIAVSLVTKEIIDKQQSIGDNTLIELYRGIKLHIDFTSTILSELIKLNKCDEGREVYSLFNSRHIEDSGQALAEYERIVNLLDGLYSEPDREIILRNPEEIAKEISELIMLPSDPSMFMLKVDQSIEWLSSRLRFLSLYYDKLAPKMPLSLSMVITGKTLLIVSHAQHMLGALPELYTAHNKRVSQAAGMQTKIRDRRVAIQKLLADKKFPRRKTTHAQAQEIFEYAHKQGEEKCPGLFHTVKKESVPYSVKTIIGDIEALKDSGKL